MRWSEDTADLLSLHSIELLTRIGCLEGLEDSLIALSVGVFATDARASHGCASCVLTIASAHVRSSLPAALYAAAAAADPGARLPLSLPFIC